MQSTTEHRGEGGGAVRPGGGPDEGGRRLAELPGVAELQQWLTLGVFPHGPARPVALGLPPFQVNRTGDVACNQR